MKLLSVIIPAHNEQESVERVLLDINKQKQAIATIGYDLEIVVVLNCCTDDTGPIAQRISFAHDIPTRLVKEDRKGYGYAHRRGYAEGRGDVFLTLDCDNTYPTEIIPNILKEIETGCSFVTTNRLADDPAMTMRSRIGNFLLTTATNILAGVKLEDSQSGMWAFKREHLADLMGGLGSGMELSEQLKIRLGREAAVWVEIPIEYRERTGESKLNPVGDGIRCLWRLVTI